MNTAPRNHSPYSDAEKNQILEAFRAGADPAKIAADHGRTEPAIKKALFDQGIRARPYQSPDFGAPAEKRGSDSIVEQAKIVLRRRFEERAGVWLLDRCPCNLNRLMTEANKALYARGLPQLGRNPAWLVN